MTYTPEMEKAMQQSHQMGYAEYERKLEKRIAVEKNGSMNTSSANK